MRFATMFLNCHMRAPRSAADISRRSPRPRRETDRGRARLLWRPTRHRTIRGSPGRARLGRTEEVIARIEQAEGKERAEIAIWPENWNIVLAFAAIATQWRTVPLATGRLHYVGLDYASARAGLDAQQIEVTPELWTGIRTMETAARQAANGE
ncbi:MAG: DUF1799 domain-containing protein [Sphingomonadaceae bacterium]|nr:DUF1799 domain-containing protein [Sphingomonadaceae bacterium]